MFCVSHADRVIGCKLLHSFFVFFAVPERKERVTSATKICKQESIPVGCVSPASVATSGGGIGGCLPLGPGAVCLWVWGGVCLWVQGMSTTHTTPFHHTDPVNRTTDRQV